MYTRSDSLAFSLPTNTFFQPQSQFDYRPMMPRNTEPEIFTFERIPEPQQPAFPPRGAAVRPRKRNTRVMYPSKVRKYLPPAEKSPAKRWLLVLCLVVFMQIYTEEESVETTQSEATSYNVLPFQPAEEQARQMMGSCPEDISLMSHQQLRSSSKEPKEISWLLNTTCPSSSWEEDINTLYQQSRRNGYVVALLYPVYHRLGTEN
ncbi:radiation-inducible immediate-early gene IEX-1-like [Sinocyclocheilus grahami]|uniref:Radiation-inducible immediate-early gene IEX-1-like n=1 Tax=Sinocyclocheilus grahami TaxID=75366 RepID=A0A672MN41_SINGR|nr:PREDICTED: radiation-inducible immediate-early gene IEX-1-like [Sinocyclocheilus grahami]